MAAFDLCGEPHLLIADHVEAPSKRLVYEVEDLDEAVEELRGPRLEAAGRQVRGPRLTVRELQRLEPE